MAKSSTVVIEVSLPPEQAEAALYQAFLRGGVQGGVGGGGGVDGTVATSWASWGENVSATIGYGPRGPQSAVVQLRSESAMPTTLVDFGKNRKNLDKVVEAMRTLAPVV